MFSLYRGLLLGDIGLVSANQMDIFDFSLICERVPFSICPALGITDSTCFARNVSIGPWLLFQPATVAIDIGAIIMTLIMVYHIRSKYTAVGRKEMVLFFYYYLADVFLELLLISNIIPSTSSIYKYFAAIHVGTICATCLILMMNGFVSFQWAEDGTSLSVWSFRITSLIYCVFGTAVGLAAFLKIGGSLSSMVLFIVFWFVNAAFVLVYLISQIILVLIAIDDRWSLGDLFFGFAFLSLGVLASGTSIDFCKAAAHYLDGLFLTSSMILLAVMMTYKYWDSITHEDLEFSVAVNHLWALSNAKEHEKEL